MAIDQKLTNWLLNAESPTIRYRTLVELLGRSSDDPEVISAKQAIMSEGPVPHILSEQKANGQWKYVDHYYTPKYVSTHWSLLGNCGSTSSQFPSIPPSSPIQRQR